MTPPYLPSTALQGLTKIASHRLLRLCRLMC
jgi:hypothetical protein